MAFMQQRLANVHIDTFDRSNGALGSSWITENVYASAGGINSAMVPEVFSNGIRNAAVLTNDRNYQSYGLYLESFVTDNVRVEGICNSAASGLYGGIIVRGSADGQNYVVVAVSTSATLIQTRIAGTYSSPRVSTSGNFFTTNDTIILESVENVYYVKRIRSGSETTITTWTDSSNDFPRGVDKTRMGYFGHSDRNFFGTQGWGLRLSHLSGRDLYNTT